MNTKFHVESKSNPNLKAIVTDSKAGSEYLTIFVFSNELQIAAHLTSRCVSVPAIQALLNMYR